MFSTQIMAGKGGEGGEKLFFFRSTKNNFQKA